MKTYTFEELTDIEFQDLVNDLLAKKLGCAIERFKPGRDGGIDGRLSWAKGIGVIQTKHYRGSGISKLISKIKSSECEKAKTLQTSRYFFVTSLGLSPLNKNKIIAAFSGVPLESRDILGSDEVNALLREFPDVHRTYYKLWSDSANSLSLFLHPEINAREIALKDRLQRINKLFVETEDFRPALESMNTSHVVVLSGEPGVGKTTLAEYLCQVHMKEGYRIDVIEGDITQYPIDLTDPDKKVLLYFDDFLGANYFAAVSGNQDSSIVRLLDQVRNEPNKRIILTSRANIIGKAEIFSQSFRTYGLARRQYVININRYSRITKAKILYTHLWHSALDDRMKSEIAVDDFFCKVIDHRNFNPRLIAFGLTVEGQNSKSLAKSLHDHLERPDQIWDHCYTVQLDEQARILVKLCVAAGGKASEGVLSQAYELALREYQFVPTSNQPRDFSYTSRLVCNSLLVKNIGQMETIYSQFNPSVSDFVIGRINSLGEARKLVAALDSENVVKFYNDLIRSKKMRRSEATSVSSLLLDRYLDTDDNRFAIALDLALYLEDETPLLKIAIEQFTKLDLARAPGISSYRLASILEKIFAFGVGETKYLEALNCRSFGHSQLNDFYVVLADVAGFNEVKTLLKEQILQSLEEDIDDIINESDGLDECNDEDDVFAFAEGCVDSLLKHYGMLDQSDVLMLKMAYSIDGLLERARERWDSCDDDVESSTTSWEDLDSDSEDALIKELFRKFKPTL
ncbi:GTP-binding protein [Cyanobium sp. Lug-B]|uniref:nSTAND3 domain-containing NTPase n=1 Tax=Cyanobium sp. Lug-B TaxID=2823716 RepID=UPI0020CDF9CF|nr:GTP-binding protein [Cyanobium sp. Lug-B]MCP9796807.1 restriction endonuclease [Cyanobium sp. Lug-B]